MSIGELPGGAPLVETRRVGDWEKELAKEVSRRLGYEEARAVDRAKHPGLLSCDSVEERCERGSSPTVPL